MPQTQGSSFLATLGLETESLQDSQFEKVYGPMARPVPSEPGNLDMDALHWG
jgi:hypothetical protein